MKCRAEGHRVEVRVTYEAEDSERYIAEALNKRGVDTIVAAGGDGMVNQVSSSDQSRWPMADQSHDQGSA